jgi:hypothetical protein
VSATKSDRHYLDTLLSSKWVIQLSFVCLTKTDEVKSEKTTKKKKSLRLRIKRCSFPTSQTGAKTVHKDILDCCVSHHFCVLFCI